ncbi:MAG TPA: sugar phosphate isomerase/epimerase family protein [Clostridia bacterium]|nr:sugar phosphate isomerase/epimerase family protein [Clostridia bacterium]
MKLGIVYFMAYPFAMTGEGDIERTVRRILEDPDFDCIEMTHVNDPALRARLKAWIEQSGITLTYGAQPQLLRNQENVNSLDEALRRRAVERLKGCIDEAYEMGAQGFAFLAGKYSPETVEQSYQALTVSTRELCAYAAAKGDMPVNLEVFDYDVEKCSLIGPADLAARFAKEMSAQFESFGLMIDLSHIAQLHSGIDANIDPVVPYIRHVHIANAVLTQGAQAYGDQHPRFGFPHGVVDDELLVVFLRKLFAIGYLGEGRRPVVSFEVKPWGDEDSECVIANAKRFLTAAWAKV